MSFPKHKSVLSQGDCVQYYSCVARTQKLAKAKSELISFGIQDALVLELWPTTELKCHSCPVAQLVNANISHDGFLSSRCVITSCHLLSQHPLTPQIFFLILNPVILDPSSCLLIATVMEAT